MTMQPIRTDMEYRQAVRAMQAFFVQEPESVSPEGKRLEELLLTIGAYESEKVASKDPVYALRYRMEQSRQYNLMPDIAPENTVQPISVIEATVENVVDAVHQRLLPFKEMELMPDAACLSRMQNAVNVLFQSHTLRKVYKCEWGMLLTGLEIMFNPRVEAIVGRMSTAWPSEYGLPGGPRYQAEARDAVVLGTFGESDLHLVQQDGLSTLVARHGPGAQYTTFCPVLSGDADIKHEPLLHAYFRAALLGYIDM